MRWFVVEVEWPWPTGLEVRFEEATDSAAAVAMVRHDVRFMPATVTVVCDTGGYASRDEADAAFWD